MQKGLASAVFVVILGVSGLSAQVQQEWVARYNGPQDGWDQAFAMALDSMGSVYVTGRSGGSGGFNYNFATVKYDSSGNQVWSAEYAGPGGTDEAFAIAVDEAGNAYVTGRSAGVRGDFDYATVKYDSTGGQAWVARYDGDAQGADGAVSIGVDSAGHVYVTGWSWGGTDGYDYATIKYSAEGEQFWAARYNAAANDWDEARALVLDGSGNVYVTGRSVGVSTRFDYATIKYDSAGSEVWSARYNNPLNNFLDEASALAVDVAGNVYVTGRSVGSSATYDYVTVKYDPEGNLLWTGRYDSSFQYQDEATAIAVDVQGNVYVTGASQNSVPQYDYATIKYDPSGVSKWLRRYDGEEGRFDDIATAIAVDADGNAYVTGGSGGRSGDFATVKYEAEGDRSWLVRDDSGDFATGIAVDGLGNVYVTGYGEGAVTGDDYATIKYSPNPPGRAELVRDINPGLGRSGSGVGSIPNRYIVVLKDDVEDVAGQAVRLAATNQGHIKWIYRDALKGFAVEMAAADAAGLAGDPRVAYVEQDQVMSAFVTQSPATWGLDRIDQRELPLSDSYSFSRTGAGVNIYIIDSGILTTHNEFAPNRAVRAFTSIQDGLGANDCNGHGTHVAGTAGGRTYGVAKRVNLFAIRVLDCAGNGTTAGVIAGVDWVTANHVKPAVANMSLGGAVSSALDSAVANSVNAGVTYVVAAGNSSQDACTVSPARTPDAITVGATNRRDRRAGFSNFGACLDIFAPGRAITSAYHISPPGIATLDGTSMASPHVAGAAALYLEANPLSTPADVVQALVANSTLERVTNAGGGSPNRLLYTDFITGEQPDPPELWVFGRGSGTGTVASSPAGISCTIMTGVASGSCQATYDSGTVVTLTAAATVPSTFEKWGGACSGTNPTCQVTMSETQSVTATFTAGQRMLIVRGGGLGSGTVTSTPAGINCTITTGATSETCEASFALGTVVTLTAVPAASNLFVGWSGACRGSSTSCQVTMSQARTVTATFTRSHVLAIGMLDVGSGTVTSSPAGISCVVAAGIVSGICQAPFADGITVTLTAAAGAASEFGGWGGACSGMESTCQVTVNQDRGATATFTPSPVLYLGLYGPGTGRVTSSPAGMDCIRSHGGPLPQLCEAPFPTGTAVTLTATGTELSSFAGWGPGVCTGMQPTCQVTMIADQSVAASFNPPPVLGVGLPGSGNGTVTSNPAGIRCVRSGGVRSGDCSAPFALGTVVTLTATPAGDSDFTGWGPTGACVGTEPTCQVTMSRDQGATANFRLGPELQVGLGSSGIANGMVTSSPAGINDCALVDGMARGTCRASFTSRTDVTLTATPTGLSTFYRWTAPDACAGRREPTCQFRMTDQTQVATAWFRGPVNLQVGLGSSGAANGTVRSSPAGIECTLVDGMGGGTCMTPFMFDRLVTLTATPTGLSTFDRWTAPDACAGRREPTCQFRMTDQTQVATAWFRGPVNLEVWVGSSGAANGTVTSSPAGIECTLVDGMAGGTCRAPFAFGTVVTLTATPTGLSTFDRWSAPGGCPGRTEPTCAVTAGQQIGYAVFRGP